MPIQFSPSDYQALVTLISQEPRFRTARERYALASEALAGNERADELLATIDWEGSSRTVAIDLIERLRFTGWLTKDTHALGVLVNDILTYRGDADPQAPFLRAWIDRNHLAPGPVHDPGLEGFLEVLALGRGELIVEDDERGTRALDQVAQLVDHGFMEQPAIDQRGHIGRGRQGIGHKVGHGRTPFVCIIPPIAILCNFK